MPKGPLLLRDIGRQNLNPFGGKHGHHGHKYNHIKRLVSFFDDAEFILVGDSGQQDPEIYLQAARDFPGRIAGIYIREAGDKSQAEAREQLSRDPYPLPEMHLNPHVTDIFDFKYEDFELIGYKAHPHIKAKVAV